MGMLIALKGRHIKLLGRIISNGSTPKGRTRNSPGCNLGKGSKGINSGRVEYTILIRMQASIINVLNNAMQHKSATEEWSKTVQKPIIP